MTQEEIVEFIRNAIRIFIEVNKPEKVRCDPLEMDWETYNEGFLDGMQSILDTLIPDDEPTVFLLRKWVVHRRYHVKTDGWTGRCPSTAVDSMPARRRIPIQQGVSCRSEEIRIAWTAEGFWKEKHDMDGEGISTLRLIGELGSFGLLAYLAIWGIPSAVKAWAKSCAEMDKRHEDNRREIRESFLRTIDAIIAQHQRQHDENVAALRRLAASIGAAVQHRRGNRSDPDNRPREVD
jgi:hypothetical protein